MKSSSSSVTTASPNTDYPVPVNWFPLLQIAPSKTDTERLILVSPELAEVLSAVVQRSRQPNGSIPLVAAYDTQEKLWNPPMPLLFQRGIGNERRAIPPSFVRKLLINALTVAALTDASGDPLMFQAPRLPANIRHRRDHERPATPYRTGYLRAQDN